MDVGIGGRRAQTGTEWHRRAQTGTEGHRRAQTGTEGHRLAQTGTDWHRRAQTGTEGHRRVQKGTEEPGIRMNFIFVHNYLESYWDAGTERVKREQNIIMLRTNS